MKQLVLKERIRIYEESLNQLIGKKTERVVYFEIDSDEAMYDQDDYHSLDYGLQIQTQTEEKFYFIWGSQYTQFDLKFGKGEIFKEFAKDAELGIYDVSQHEKWKPLIQAEIVTLQSYWDHYVQDFPQGVEITFSNGKQIYVSVISIFDDKKSYYNFADEMTLFFMNYSEVGRYLDKLSLS
ncbi:MAG: hypothetical protein AAF740_12450 [Bacteroidota bacterium]